MRKILFLLVFFITFFASASYAQVSEFGVVRRNLVDKSQTFREYLGQTQDVVITSSMWDSCVLAVSQIDAYYAMVGIIQAAEAVENKEAAFYLIDWLERIKRTNVANLRSLSNTGQAAEEKTVEYMKKLYRYFSEFNEYVEQELKKIKELESLL